MKQKLLLTLSMLFSLMSVAQTDFYVKKNGLPNGSADSWDNANSNLQATVNKAGVGDIVHVASGTYEGGFIMKEGVTVLGGYPANADATTTLENRKMPGSGQNLTILDGQTQNRPLTQYVANAQSVTKWDGFVIQNGTTDLKDGSIITNLSGKPIGVLYDYNSTTKTGMMLSPNEEIRQWGEFRTNISGLSDIATPAAALLDMSGKQNTAITVAQLGQDKSYAQEWVIKETQGNYLDWYLPACGELLKIFQDKATLNTTLDVIGGKPLTDAMYWSSSEYDAYEAWSLDFINGNAKEVIKDYESSVRPVRTFDLQNSLSTTTVANGGGVHLLAGGHLSNCIIKNNKAEFRGGGVYAAEGATVEGCLVEANSAQGGQGILGENATVINCTVVKNLKHGVAIPAAPAIGDYYYDDNTWSTALDNAKTLAGVVIAISSTNAYSGIILNIEESAPLNPIDAKQWANGLTTAGYNDWRLPTILEYETIFKDFEEGNASVINTALQGAGSATKLAAKIYTSEIEKIGENSIAWFIDFSQLGHVTSQESNVSATQVARAIRQF